MNSTTPASLIDRAPRKPLTSRTASWNPRDNSSPCRRRPCTQRFQKECDEASVLVPSRWHYDRYAAIEDAAQSRDRQRGLSPQTALSSSLRNFDIVPPLQAPGEGPGARFARVPGPLRRAGPYAATRLAQRGLLRDDLRRTRRRRS